MYPVDLLKTRMQILHPTSGALYTGLTNAVSTIYRIEGWRTLWKGVSSVIVGAGKELIMDICAWIGRIKADVFDSMRQARPMRYTLERMSLSRSLQVGMWTMGIIRWRLVS